MSRKTHPIQYEYPNCANPECGASFKKMKGSPVRLCESCLIHPNLVARYPIRNEAETERRRDF